MDTTCIARARVRVVRFFMAQSNDPDACTSLCLSVSVSQYSRSQAPIHSLAATVLVCFLICLRFLSGTGPPKVANQSRSARCASDTYIHIQWNAAHKSYTINYRHLCRRASQRQPRQHRNSRKCIELMFVVCACGVCRPSAVVYFVCARRFAEV